jgi:hypothetical protein
MRSIFLIEVYDLNELDAAFKQFYNKAKGE